MLYLAIAVGFLALVVGWIVRFSLWGLNLR